MSYRIGGNQVCMDCPEVPVVGLVLRAVLILAHRGMDKAANSYAEGDWSPLGTLNKDKGREPGYSRHSRPRDTANMKALALSEGIQGLSSPPKGWQC